MLLFITNAFTFAVICFTFQYISCYCLSTFLCYFRFLQLHFNTSHVTVYRLNQQDLYSNEEYFNTSHVTVYPNADVPISATAVISIHLMLLFINIGHGVYYGIYLFQYISCYCLSQIKEFSSRLIRIFQYISCYCLSSNVLLH